MTRFTPILLLTLTALAVELHAASPQPAGAEQRLRESLRTTMLQLRTLETERATLQANQLVNEAKIKELDGQVESLNKKIAALNKQAIADQEAAQKSMEGLKANAETLEKRIVQLTESLEKWKVGYADAVKVARAKDAERAKNAAKVIELQRTVADRERKNLELYHLSSEILERYQNFGLGTALTAREPFVGTTKVKLQTLVQDYADKLQDQKHSPFDEKKQPKSAADAYDATNGRPSKKEAAAVETPTTQAAPIR
jgi:chromosome segregation ATPase